MTISPGRRLASYRPLSATALLLVLLASPASAADLQLDNIKLDLGKFVLSIPKLEVKGTSLDRDGFLAIFQGSGDSAIARLGKLDASEINAPTLVMEQNFGPQKQVTTYRNIKFADIREGRIGRGESSDGTIKVEGGSTGPINGEIKRTSFETLDLMQIARVFAEKAKPGETAPLQPVLGKPRAGRLFARPRRAGQDDGRQGLFARLQGACRLRADGRADDAHRRAQRGIGESLARSQQQGRPGDQRGA